MTMERPATTKTTLRGLAKRLGCTHSSLSAAVHERRLTAGVDLDHGQVVVTDADAAAKQWEAIASIPAGDRNAEFRAARTRREVAMARRAEIELAQLEGSVVDVDEVRAGVVNKFTIVKTHLLGIPSRMRQRDPTLTAAQITLFDDLIREALTELADDKVPSLPSEDDQPGGETMTPETENSMIVAMLLLAATKAGDFCRDHGYPPPTEEQTAQMSAQWRNAFTAFVTSLDMPDREPTDAEQKAVEDLVEGAAEGAVLAVMGQPPGSERNKN